MIITPPTIASMPPAPQTSDPATFDAKADAVLAAWPTNITEMNALGSNVYANAIAAKESADLAEIVMSNNADMWEASTNYVFGTPVWSPTDYKTYRNKVPGVHATDPSTDPTNWAATASTQLPITSSSSTTPTAAIGWHTVCLNASLVTVTLAAGAEDDVLWITFCNDLFINVVGTSSGQTIMGAASPMTINMPYQTIRFRFINSSWRLV